MLSFLKVLVEFATVLLLFYVLDFFFLVGAAVRHAGTHLPDQGSTTPCTGRPSLNYLDC